MIYIIFGASGSGKTTLLEVIREKYDNVSIHIKGTTRKKRDYDDEELMCYGDDLPNGKYDYVYGLYGYEYGIEKKQIDDALRKGENHFIICNSLEIIDRLKKDFPAKIIVIYLRFDAPRSIIEQIQNTRNISDDEIELRLNKISKIEEDFLNHSEVFDEVIVNTFGKIPEKSLTRQINRILSNYPNRNNASIQKAINDIEHEKRNDKKEKFFEPGLVFIIMPINDEDMHLNDVYYSIKNAVERLGLKPVRIDDTFGAFELITVKILNHIALAEYVIADLSYERPNCYYELGYAHALNKKIILTASYDTKIHFDVSGFHVCKYKSVRELDEKISLGLKTLINEKDEI